MDKKRAKDINKLENIYKEMEMDIPQKFWAEYEKADCFERKHKIRFIAKDLITLIELKIDTKVKERIIITFLQSYFDDLIQIKLKK